MISLKRMLFTLNKTGRNECISIFLSKLRDPNILHVRHVNDVDFCPNLVRGIDHLRDPKFNKGLAFTLEERQALGIMGLLAPVYKTQEQQLKICQLALDRYDDDLHKYYYLVQLHDSNERLFFSLISQNVEKYMPIVYTPTVGLACQRFGLVYKKAKGLFITINDKGHIFNILRNWPEHDVRAIVFTDGERILGLGDLGAYGMGIPIGKLALYTALAGIKPHQCLPITLDVGTDNQELLEDPLYIGLRQKRVRGQEYDDFIAEFMVACIKRYGANILLQFEDFGFTNATRLLNMYKEMYCTFNDDVQGTASVAVAGLMASQRITKKKLTEYVFLFLGAGSAATGIANLTVAAMVEQGLSEQEAIAKVFLYDINGLLTTKRNGGIPDHCKHLAKDMEHSMNFEQCVEKLKPTCLIGCSTVAGAFNEKILKQMATNSERPVIFALSNPTSRAECTPQQAYDITDGKCIFASGSPFPPVKHGGKEYLTGQGNNAYIFPGLALGIIAVRARTIPEPLFLGAARTLANFVREEDLAKGLIYPPLIDIQKVSYLIAVEVIKLSYDIGIATVYPKPTDINKFLSNHIYDLKYQNHLPHYYPYPKGPEISIKSVEEVYKVYRPPPQKKLNKY